MKKILVLISNYGSNQLNFCQILISGLLSINKYSFDIKVFSSEDTSFEGCENIIVRNYSGHDFPNSIYDYLKQVSLESYSHILFTENDLFFSEVNFDTYFNYESKLTSQNETIGFLRYEIKNEGKYLIDCGYNSDKLSFSNKNGIMEINDISMFRYKNCHQGCWFLNKSQVIKIINEISVGSTLEDKASNFYYSEFWPGTQNGIKKYIPFCSFEDLLIHHQPNKYVNIYNDLPSIINLLSERNESIICD